MHVMESYNSVCELTGQPPLTPADLSRAQVSFLIARSIEDLDLRQSLLAERSEVARLRTLAKYLPDHLRRMQRIAHAKQMAPRNGRGNLNGIH